MVKDETQVAHGTIVYIGKIIKAAVRAMVKGETQTWLPPLPKDLRALTSTKQNNQKKTNI